jgi:Bacteriophage tail sheath protein
MPTLPTYPGVYVEELPSGVRPINAVATSVAAFVGLTPRGLDQRPQRLFSFADFERAFGGLGTDSLVGYAVSHFFANGGSEAWVVRVPKPDSVAAVIALRDAIAAGNEALRVTALSRGAWANDLLVDVDHDVPAGDAKAFNLTITDVGSGAAESFPNVTLDNTRPNFVESVVNDQASGSRLVSVRATPASGRPVATGTVGGTVNLGALQNDQGYRLRVTIDVPAATNVDVTVIEQGETLPSSLLGLCNLIERRVNLALGAAVPGARIRCTPTGGRLRLQADFSPLLLGGALDATITLAAVAPSALTMLSLTAAQTTVNVGHYRLGLGRTVAAQSNADEGEDGDTYPETADLIGSQAQFTGIYALDRVDSFNLLVIPDATRPDPANPGALNAGVSPNDVWSAALEYCNGRRAMLLIDPPPTVNDLDSAVDWISGGLTVKGPNATAYFPRVRAGDPLDDFKPRLFAPGGALAGVIARGDSERGVWKAPAGTSRRVAGVAGLEVKLTDDENGVLNPLGLNCLRTFPIYGTVAWGARTLDGADVAASQWKYLPVRRLALMIEESLYRGTQWAVFEPNDEPLWAQLRLNITAFMQGLFRQGAFQGTTPAQAYLVKCDSSTTTQADIDRGIVNILVGFAPLKPAEFVFIRLQQLAGQSS